MKFNDIQDTRTREEKKAQRKERTQKMFELFNERMDRKFRSHYGYIAVFGASMPI